jgi:hypothetical protein
MKWQTVAPAFLHIDSSKLFSFLVWCMRFSVASFCVKTYGFRNSVRCVLVTELCRQQTEVVRDLRVKMLTVLSKGKENAENMRDLKLVAVKQNTVQWPSWRTVLHKAVCYRYRPACCWKCPDTRCVHTHHKCGCVNVRVTCTKWSHIPLKCNKKSIL